MVATPTIQTPVSYQIAPPAPTAEVVPASGPSLDLLTLAALQQQANLGLAVPSEDLAALEAADLAIPAAAATCACSDSTFEFPQFGQATSRLYQPWGKMYEPLRRLFQPVLY